MAKGRRPKPPGIEKIGKSPLSEEAGPSIWYAKRSGKLLGYFWNFLLENLEWSSSLIPAFRSLRGYTVEIFL